MNLRMDYILLGGGALAALYLVLKSREEAPPGLDPMMYQQFMADQGGGTPYGLAAPTQHQQHVALYGGYTPPAAVGTGMEEHFKWIGAELAKPDEEDYGDQWQWVEAAGGEQLPADVEAALGYTTGQFYPGSLVPNPAIAARQMLARRMGR